MITAQIIADSINTVGKRLTTYILEYPRFVHAELMTHRMFSKNAASSRAIPIEKMIQQIIDNPAMPVWWGKNQSGMQAKEELDDTVKKYPKPGFEHGYYPEHFENGFMTAKEAAKFKWLAARDVAIGQVKSLMELGLHKQIANRILEPWFNIRIILSGTEFENFFALRVHPDAQPEIQELARKMLELYNTSVPKVLNEGEWHIPFGDNFDEDKLNALYDSLHGPQGRFVDSAVLVNRITDLKKKIAIARCARISYLNYEGKDDYFADVTLCDRLFGSVPRHLSPTEHVAQAMNSFAFVGNFSGFKQYRYLFADQNLSDNRVKKYTRNIS